MKKGKKIKEQKRPRPIYGKKWKNRENNGKKRKKREKKGNLRILMEN